MLIAKKSHFRNLLCPKPAERALSAAALLRRRLVVGCRALLLSLFALLLTVGSASATSDFEIRRALRADKALLVYHDPLIVPPDGAVRVELSRGGCETQAPPQNVRQLGDSFATLIVIDRGDPAGMGQWSKQLLGGVADYLRGEGLAHRPAPDDYALLDSYGTPPAREQPLTSEQFPLQRFLDDAPKPEQAGAAVYRRTLDALRLLEPTQKPLRAVVIISDGSDPNLYPGGVADDSLLIKRARELGAPIFAVIVARKPTSKHQRSLLQAAATRLQAVAVTSGGGVIQEIPADENLRSALSQALSSFSQRIGAWQRTSCLLCGDAGGAGETAVELSVRRGNEVVARARQPYPARITSVGSLPRCKGCANSSECACTDGQEPSCKEGRCGCAGDCKNDGDCSDGKVCTEGACKDGPPWLWIIGALGLLGFAGLGMLLVVSKARSDVREARRREEEERRRRQADAQGVRQQAAAQAQGAQPHPGLPHQAPAQGYAQQPGYAQPPPAAAPAPVPMAYAAPVGAYAGAPAPVATARPSFVLRSRTQGCSDIWLSEGTVLVGGDAGELQHAGTSAPGALATALVALQTVSARHAVFRVGAGRVSVSDVGSTNGTFVNGVRIDINSVVELRAGDQVELSRHAVFVLERPPA